MCFGGSWWGDISMKQSTMEAPAIPMPQVLSQPGGSNKEQAADYNKFNLFRH